jgi:hypothetical protein
LRLAPLMHQLISACQKCLHQEKEHPWQLHVCTQSHKKVPQNQNTGSGTQAWHLQGLRLRKMRLPPLSDGAQRIPNKMDQLGHSAPIHLYIKSHAQRGALLPIQHGRGLRQGDPLSPLLFILAIDPLTWLLETATDRGLLSKLNGSVARFRTSMYADDVVIFLKPTIKDVTNLNLLLENFGLVTCLQTNLQKTTASAVSCGGIDLNGLLPDYRWPALTSPSNILGCHSWPEDCAGWTSNRKLTKLQVDCPRGTGETSLSVGSRIPTRGGWIGGLKSKSTTLEKFN